MKVNKDYLEYRYINNRRLNATEDLIMNKIRKGEYCSGLIEYREKLKERLKINERNR